jgi:DNA-binding MarR family transcriptional regulator
MKNYFDDLAQLIAEFSQVYARYAQEHRLNFNELHFLYYIYNHDNQAHANEISKRWSIPKQTINSMINKFRDAAVLAVTKDPTDGRKRLLSLTPRGKELVRPLVDELTASELAVQQKHPADFAQLLPAFQKIKDDFRDQLNPDD